MIKVGICEDQKISREVMRNLLQQYFAEKGASYLLREYESAKAFMEQKEETDILILDIEMEGITGLQLKDWLWREDQDARILFVTHHVKEMPQAFGKNVYGFLQKPVQLPTLKKYIDRMIEDIEESQTFLIKSVNRELPVKINNIFYFVSEHKYSRMLTSQGEYFCDVSLIQLEEELRNKSFFRCHKCYLVNLRNIMDIKEMIHMANGDQIPVSRRKIKELKDSYRAYIIRKAK